MTEQSPVEFWFDFSSPYSYIASECIYRDARVCQIYEGASDIQRQVIGRSLVAYGNIPNER